MRGKDTIAIPTFQNYNIFFLIFFFPFLSLSHSLTFSHFQKQHTKVKMFMQKSVAFSYSSFIFFLSFTFYLSSSTFPSFRFFLIIIYTTLHHTIFLFLTLSPLIMFLISSSFRFSYFRFLHDHFPCLLFYSFPSVSSSESFRSCFLSLSSLFLSYCFL